QAAPDRSLVLPPGVPKVATGPALEDVYLVRDENANLVWGIETTVRMETGEGRRGDEAATPARAQRPRPHPPPPPGDPRASRAPQEEELGREDGDPVHRGAGPGRHRRGTAAARGAPEQGGRQPGTAPAHPAGGGPGREPAFLHQGGGGAARRYPPHPRVQPH